jgi:hypothetical protein
MAISSKENGVRIKLMVMVFIFMSMVLNMKGIGKMTSKTVMVSRHGQMALSTKEITKRAKNMDREYIHGVMGPNTMASG